MSITNSIIVPSSFVSLHLQTCNRFQAVHLNNPEAKFIFRGRARPSINTSRRTMVHKPRDVVVYCSILPGGPLDPTGSSSGSWKGWIIGMLLTVIIPFWRNKWGPLLQLKSKVEQVVQTVEDITEAVEKVAEKVDEVTEDFAEHLPAGKLKDAVTFLEKAAERVAKDAHLADEVIDKIQEVDKEMETFIEHVADEANDIAHDANVIAKEASEIAKDANEHVADEANGIAHEANVIAKEANEIANDANEVAKEVNDIANEAKEVSKEVNEIANEAKEASKEVNDLNQKAS